MTFKNTKSYKKLTDLAKNPIDLTKEGVFTAQRVKSCKIENLKYKLLYAAERVDENVIEELKNLAEEMKVVEKMHQMQEGKVINTSENREVLHTATRDFFEDPINSKQAKEAARLAYLEVKKLDRFLKKIDGQFSTLVQIGIGGSFLGPKALYHALEKYNHNKAVKFISNVDPDDAIAVLKEVDLKKTLFVVVSKSGTTLETLTNEEFVKEVLIKKGLKPKDHIVSVTAKDSPMDDPNNYLESFYIWDYIGGRYSATAMVGGVSLGFAFGVDVYRKILHGASNMDKVALDSDINKNLPLFSALLGIWNRNFLNHPTASVIPYSQALLYFPLHLQQLDMESNGKSVNVEGKKIDYRTGPVTFGDIGTNAQHSFFQLLHQGTDIVPIEFVGFKKSQYNKDLKVKGTSSQEKLLANMLAQSIALATGKKDKNPNKNFSGNRVNHILAADELTPYNLGALLSYFENKIAFQGFIWGINSFDQEGVQLGKVLANKILDIYQEKETNFDTAKAYLNHLK